MLNKQWGRWTVLATLSAGVVFHATRLTIGVGAFQQLFTATIDAVFSLPMIAGIIGTITTWKHFDFRGRLEKGVVIFTLAYFTLTMPLHFKTWFTGNTDYIAKFPWWYSLVFITYTSLLLFVWARLRVVRADSAAGAPCDKGPDLARAALRTHTTTNAK